MNKKFIYLFLALALPGLIFVFLKKFGKNEFNVKVYYETGIPEDSICGIPTAGAYHVPDSVISKIGLGQSVSASVIIIYPFVKDNLSEVNRIKEKYADEKIDMVILSGIPNHRKSQFRQLFLNYHDFGKIVWCLLRVQEPWSVVLLDGKNRIRGYYDGSLRDEIDRLDLELSILLKKY